MQPKFLTTQQIKQKLKHLKITLQCNELILIFFNLIKILFIKIPPISYSLPYQFELDLFLIILIFSSSICPTLQHRLNLTYSTARVFNFFIQDRSSPWMYPIGFSFSIWVSIQIVFSYGNWHSVNSKNYWILFSSI